MFSPLVITYLLLGSHLSFLLSNLSAIYMFRDPDFLQSLSKEQLSEYRDPLASQRIQFIKNKLKETAPVKVQMI